MIPDIVSHMTGYWIWRICTEKPREEALSILIGQYGLSAQQAEQVYLQNINRGKTEK